MESGCNGHRGAHALNRVEVGHRTDQELVIPPKMEENRAQEMELSLNLVTPKIVNRYKVTFLQETILPINNLQGNTTQ